MTKNSQFYLIQKMRNVLKSLKKKILRFLFSILIFDKFSILYFFKILRKITKRFPKRCAKFCNLEKQFSDFSDFCFLTYYRFFTQDSLKIEHNSTINYHTSTKKIVSIGFCSRLDKNALVLLFFHVPLFFFIQNHKKRSEKFLNETTKWCQI